MDESAAIVQTNSRSQRKTPPMKIKEEQNVIDGDQCLRSDANLEAYQSQDELVDSNQGTCAMGQSACDGDSVMVKRTGSDHLANPCLSASKVVPLKTLAYRVYVHSIPHGSKKAPRNNSTSKVPRRTAKDTNHARTILDFDPRMSGYNIDAPFVEKDTTNNSCVVTASISSASIDNFPVLSLSSRPILLHERNCDSKLKETTGRRKRSQQHYGFIRKAPVYPIYKPPKITKADVDDNINATDEESSRAASTKAGARMVPMSSAFPSLFTSLQQWTNSHRNTSETRSDTASSTSDDNKNTWIDTEAPSYCPFVPTLLGSTTNGTMHDSCSTSSSISDTTEKLRPSFEAETSAHLVKGSSPNGRPMHKYEFKNSAPSPKGSISCEICDRTFLYKSQLEIHSLMHTGKKPFPCDICQKSFRSRSHLLVHQRTHSGEKPFVCTVCQKAFSRSNNLTVHMRLHTGERPYHCELCPKTFSEKTNLLSHLKTHSGLKPYQCEVCGKVFAHKSQLTPHMRVHTGARPYKCNECEQTFSQLGHLQSHIRRHNGEKPFQCTVCLKFYRDRSQLKSHSRIHTGEKSYRCEHCTEAFRYKCQLTKHLKVHMEEEEAATAATAATPD